jgi:hypothetical protein
MKTKQNLFRVDNIYMSNSDPQRACTIPHYIKSAVANPTKPNATAPAVATTRSPPFGLSLSSPAPPPGASVPEPPVVLVEELPAPPVGLAAELLLVLVPPGGVLPVLAPPVVAGAALVRPLPEALGLGPLAPLPVPSLPSLPEILPLLSATPPRMNAPVGSELHESTKAI